MKIGKFAEAKFQWEYRGKNNIDKIMSGPYMFD